MKFIIWNEQEGLVHFARLYETIEEAANDLHNHLQEAPFEYNTQQILEITDLRESETDETEVIRHTVARIHIRQRAWITIPRDNDTLRLILPKKSPKKALPHIENVVLWDFKHRRQFSAHIYPTLLDAANDIGKHSEFVELGTVLGVFNERDLAQHMLDHNKQIMRDDAPYIITISKDAWLSYEEGTQKDLVLLPISERARKRRLRKQKSTK